MTARPSLARAALILALGLAVTQTTPLRVAADPEAPPPVCTPANAAAARAAFDAAYAAGRYGDAAGVLQPIYDACDAAHRRVSDETVGAVASDLGLAHHRAGDDMSCLGVLEDYSPALNHPHRAMTRLSPTLQAAIRHNFKLCLPGCDTADLPNPVCESIWTEQEWNKFVGGFSQPPCPLGGGHEAVALPGGACVTLLPRRQAFSSESVDFDHPGTDMCPRLARIERLNGKTVTTAIAAPAETILTNLGFCCDPMQVGVDAAGRIAVTPKVNPPGDCLSGHTTDVMQDIFVIEGAKARLVHRLSKPLPLNP